MLNGPPIGDDRYAGPSMDDDSEDSSDLGEALQQVRDEDDSVRAAREKSEVRMKLFGAPPRQLEIGRYVLGEHLGTGGMGEVFVAHDPTLDRPVAVKLLHRDPERDTTQHRTRMIREARTLAKISHPNVVQVYEVGESNGRVFIAMELIRGASMRKWHDSGERGWREVLGHYLAAGRGLRAVHEAGLIHRDFKPDNVLLGVDGRVCVADFGLARHASGPITASTATVESETTLLSGPGGGAPMSGTEPRLRLTRTGRIAGTPAYMAPEQLHGDELDPRTDQFAFCLTLYEGLYGQRPFSCRSRGTLLQAHDRGPTPPPRGAHVPRRLWKILQRGLSKDANDRYPTMAALLEHLDPERARRRWVGGLSVGFGLSAVAAAAVWTPSADPCPRPSPQSLGWGEDARSSMLDTFDANADVEGRGEVMARRLDTITADLAARRVATCEATRVAHAQSDEMLDRRMMCMDRTSDRIRGLVVAIADADADGLERVGEAIDALPDPASCNAAALIGLTEHPETPELAASVAQLRAQLAEASAIHDLGDDRRAQRRLEVLRDEVIGLDHAPLTAELALVEGVLARHLGDPVGASKHLLVGAELAEGSRADLLAAQLWDALTFLALEDLSSREVEAWLPRARAAVRRIGSPPRWTTTVGLHEAKAAMQANALDDARAKLLDVVEQRRTQGRPLDLARALEALVHLHRLRDEPDAALARLGEIQSLYGEHLGPRHRKVADTAYNLGTILLALGRPDAARASLDEAAAIWAERYGPSHLDLALVHIALQSVEVSSGSLSAARHHAEEALRIRRLHLPDDHPDLAYAHMVLGVTLMLAEEAEAAARAYTRAWDGLRAASGPEDVMANLARANLAEAELAAGRTEAARAHAEASARVLREALGEHPSIALPLKVLGLLALHDGDQVFAVEQFDEALERLAGAQTVDPIEQGDVHLALARALAAGGRVEAARAHTREVETIHGASRADVARRQLERAHRMNLSLRPGGTPIPSLTNNRKERP
ncbi:MAG: serine/threonine-protein kinase [Deltaproteobacteria bacterium]|nr:serine/threonine-protein kinase [Deltaproteobacteria bacterium]